MSSAFSLLAVGEQRCACHYFSQEFRLQRNVHVQKDNISFCADRFICLGGEPDSGKFDIGPLCWCVALRHSALETALLPFLICPQDLIWSCLPSALGAARCGALGILLRVAAFVWIPAGC